MNDLTCLTNEEIASLDVASAQRKMGELDQALHALRTEMLDAIRAHSDANMKLKILKAQERLLIERARNLKAFIYR